jgi:hypothetical protein
MWRVITLFLVTALLAGSGCADPFPFPTEGVYPFTPDWRYRLWWEAIENCSGVRAAPSSVSWFRSLEPIVGAEGTLAAGTWYAKGNRIILYLPEGPTARHEMLHSVLHEFGHPVDFFAGRCGTYVTFAGTDVYQVSARDTVGAPTLDERKALSISVSLYPARESLAYYDYGVIFLVRIQNNGPSGWVDNVGFLAAVENLDDVAGGGTTRHRSPRMFLRAGSVRVIAVDGTVSVSADTIRVQAEVARAKSPVTVIPLR